MRSKKELRALLIERRNYIPESSRAESSSFICEKLKKLDFTKVRSLHYFEPIKSLGEVNILPFITFIHSKYPTISCIYSKKIDSKWENVTENGEIVDKNMQFDLIIVPMLGYDGALHRIGYGGGYYDKLLSQQGQSVKIGVCFEACKVDLIPTEYHDIPLDMIITEL